MEGKPYFQLFTCLLLTALKAASALRLTNMSAPAVIDFRDDLKLDCQFDMGGEQLYAVKWYKDDHEFFRYMPETKPYIITFAVFGVSLVNESIDCGPGRCALVLNNLLRVKSGGAYRCEVSTEAPAFRLASETHNVTVAAVPKSNPLIEGLETSYFEGDILAAECTTAPSDPPQTISWFINKEPAPSKYLRGVRVSKPDRDGLVTTSQELRFVVLSHYMQSRRVELTCVSAFASAPTASALKGSKSAELYERGASAPIKNQRYFLYSSSSARKTFILKGDEIFAFVSLLILSMPFLHVHV